MTRFPSAKHLTAWAGLAPGQNETGGKQRAAATRKGNRYLRWGLTQAGQAAGRTKDTYLHALYHRLAARRGKPRATLAVGRTILEMAYYLLTRETTYTDLGADYFDRQDREHATQRMVHRLEALGYTVTLTEPPLGTAA